VVGNAARLLGKTALWFVTTATVGLSLMIWHYRDISPSYLETKYGHAQSRWLNIDGARIHYVDEGPRAAPVVLLIHAHWASLIMWDGWADQLKDKYRVIRFDMTGHGLSGPDTTRDYTLGRGVKLLETFVSQLNLNTFDLIGTSLGGTHALRYAASNPNKVNRLVLLNPGALNEGVRGQDGPPSLPWWIDVLSVITPRAFFEFMLSSGYGSAEQVDESIVTRWHEMQLREGQREAEIERTRQYVSGDIERVIRSITTQTLIIWGEDNPIVPVEQAYEFVDLLESAENADLIIYPGLGHMTALEAPDKTGSDIRAYLDGVYSFASQ
jgi:pimeloyl-ACP methyl ester carboxylesterase